MINCSLAAECCICDAALCPYDELEDLYNKGVLEYDEISHEFYDPKDEHDASH